MAAVEHEHHCICIQCVVGWKHKAVDVDVDTDAGSLAEDGHLYYQMAQLVY